MKSMNKIAYFVLTDLNCDHQKLSYYFKRLIMGYYCIHHELETMPLYSSYFYECYINQEHPTGSTQKVNLIDSLYVVISCAYFKIGY